MKTVRFYGKLAKKFGKEFCFDVKTPAEAIRALSTVVPGFKQFMATNKDLYTVYVGFNDEIITQYQKPFGKEDEMRIVPIVTGSGSLGRILLGVALVFAAPYIGFQVAGAFGGSTAATMFSLTVKAVQSFGFSLILGGLSELLFSPPKQQDYSYETANNRPSFTFDGPVNTTRQGNPVPIGYGRLRVGSQVISAGLQAQAI